ncbi:MAG: peptidase M10, partial [Sphingobacteriales bacterium]
MGIVEFVNGQLIVNSHIITYGNAANELITERIRAEIETMWNEPQGTVEWEGRMTRLSFKITASCQPAITDVEIYANTDPRNNYFRIEEFVHGNISFVDALGSNTGYFKLDNLYEGSTTAAHEYGHTLGLRHPEDLDIRGKGIPGIMYPRGTLVDPGFQYTPSAMAGDGRNGGTLNPVHRRVRPEELSLLKIHTLDFLNNTAVLGEFTSMWHPDHRDISANEYLRPGT